MRPALWPLRVPAFRRLAVVRLVDELGDWLGEVALAVLVFDRTGSAIATAALFLSMQFVPALTTPPLVARLDALPSRISLTALNAVQAAVFAMLALLSAHFWLPGIIALAAVGGGLAISGRALSRAAAAAVVTPHGMLREGNALLNIGFTAGAAAGPAIAGAVVAGAGARTALFADAASFGLVAILLFTTSGLPHVRGQVAGWFIRLRQGLAYVTERPQLRLLITAQTVAVVFFTLVIPIEVVFAKRTLGAGDAGYGYFLASWGTGMLAGSILFAALGRVSLRNLLLISTLAIGSAYLVIGASPTLALACIAAAGGGAGNGVQWVGLMTAVQQLTRLDYQGRVISLLESLAKAAPALGFVMGGVSTALFNPRVSYVLAGIGVLAVLAVASVALARAGWRGEPTEAARLEDEDTTEEADPGSRRAAPAAFEPPRPG
jgi:MFS family permease